MTRSFIQFVVWTWIGIAFVQPSISTSLLSESNEVTQRTKSFLTKRQWNDDEEDVLKVPEFHNDEDFSELFDFDSLDSHSLENSLPIIDFDALNEENMQHATEARSPHGNNNEGTDKGDRGYEGRSPVRPHERTPVHNRIHAPNQDADTILHQKYDLENRRWRTVGEPGTTARQPQSLNRSPIRVRDRSPLQNRVPLSHQNVDTMVHDYDGFARWLAREEPLKGVFEAQGLSPRQQQEILFQIVASRPEKLDLNAMHMSNRRRFNHVQQFHRAPLTPLIQHVVNLDRDTLHEIYVGFGEYLISKGLLPQQQDQQQDQQQQEPGGGGSYHDPEEGKRHHNEIPPGQKSRITLFPPPTQSFEDFDPDGTTTAGQRITKNFVQDSVWHPRRFQLDPLPHYPNRAEIHQLLGHLDSGFFSLFHTDNNALVPSMQRDIRFGPFMCRIAWQNPQGLRFPHETGSHQNQRRPLFPEYYPVIYEGNSPWRRGWLKFPQPASYHSGMGPTLLHHLEMQMLSFNGDERWPQSMGGFFRTETGELGFAYRIWTANSIKMPMDPRKTEIRKLKGPEDAVLFALRKALYKTGTYRTAGPGF
ncbi:MAG: hypothetical protein M1831_007521 [Alyxoria varia]|nr:MAG: hypothetical protein M1831_007521 [Alyxoria varia]